MELPFPPSMEPTAFVSCVQLPLAPMTHCTTPDDTLAKAVPKRSSFAWPVVMAALAQGDDEPVVLGAEKTSSGLEVAMPL